MAPLTLQMFLVPSPHPSASTLTFSQSGALLNTPIPYFPFPPLPVYPFPLVSYALMSSALSLSICPLHFGPAPGRAPAFKDKRKVRMVRRSTIV